MSLCSDSVASVNCLAAPRAKLRAAQWQGWRERYRSDFEVFPAADGQRSLRRRDS